MLMEFGLAVRAQATRFGLLTGVLCAAALGSMFSVPMMADSVFCSADTPVGTGCAAVNSNVPYYGVGTATSFNGTFNNDDNIQVFEVDITTTEIIMADTFSYGGGTDLTGSTIAPGGFATELAIFTSSGGLQATGGIGDCPTSGQATNITTGECFDSAVSATLTAGTYYVVLTEDNNSAFGPNLFSGPSTVNPSSFFEGGNSNFTASYGCGGTQFCDPFGDQMNGNYAVDIATYSPEPGPGALVSSALAFGLFLLWRRRRVSAV